MSGREGSEQLRRQIQNDCWNVFGMRTLHEGGGAIDCMWKSHQKHFIFIRIPSLFSFRAHKINETICSVRSYFFLHFFHFFFFFFSLFFFITAIVTLLIQQPSHYRLKEQSNIFAKCRCHITRPFVSHLSHFLSLSLAFSGAHLIFAFYHFPFFVICSHCIPMGITK